MNVFLAYKVDNLNLTSLNLWSSWKQKHLYLYPRDYTNKELLIYSN